MKLLMEGEELFPKKAKKEFYDKENQKPVIKTSICTGKQVAGFRDIHTDKFTEAMLIRGSRDLDTFLEDYDVSVVEITKEW